MDRDELMHITISALCVLFIIGGSYLTIRLPITPVPIVLQDMMVIVAVLLLGPRWGLACVGSYLILGLLHLPVFSGGRGGFAVIIGPTGGYLLAYPVVALVAGYISQKKTLLTDIAAWIVSLVLIFGIGVPWLKFVLGVDWIKSMMAGFVPFIPGAIVKAIAGIALVRALRPLLPFRKNEGTMDETA